MKQHLRNDMPNSVFNLGCPYCRAELENLLKAPIQSRDKALRLVAINSHEYQGVRK